MMLWGRLRALFVTDDDSSVELVMTANGVASLALAALAWLQLDWPFSWSIAVVPAAFVGLTACLLFRPTVWIAAVLGGLTLAASSALLLAAVMSRLPHGHWLGAGLGGAGG